MTAKTETLHHPTLDVTYEVAAENVTEWVEAGWLKSVPKVVREKADDDA